jgi:hypothetical protein
LDAIAIEDFSSRSLNTWKQLGAAPVEFEVASSSSGPVRRRRE